MFRLEICPYWRASLQKSTLYAVTDCSEATLTCYSLQLPPHFQSRVVLARTLDHCLDLVTTYSLHL